MSNWLVLTFSCDHVIGWVKKCGETVTSLKSKKLWCVSEWLKSYLWAGICQNRLSVLVLHINFDVDSDVEQMS